MYLSNISIRVGHFPCFEFPLEKGKYCEISPREKGKNREIFVLNSQYIKIDFIMFFFSSKFWFTPKYLGILYEWLYEKVHICVEEHFWSLELTIKPNLGPKIAYI